MRRVPGETKWSFWKLFKYSLEGITAFSVGAFTNCFHLWFDIFDNCIYNDFDDCN